MGKTTNKIENIIKHAVLGEKEEAYELTDQIKELHLKTAEAFLTGGILESTHADINELISQFSSLGKKFLKYPKEN